MPFPSFSGIIKIFFSYEIHDRVDRNLLGKFKKQMIFFLQKMQDVEIFFQDDIRPGDDKQKFFDTHLSNADIIVFLINNDFLMIHLDSAEMKRAFERCEAGMARIISVPLRPILWEVLPDKFGLLPLDGKPLSERPNKDAILVEIVRSICKVVDEMSQFASSLTSNRGPKFSSGIPHRRNPFFTGRDEVLTTLHDQFFSEHPLRTVVQALSGPGGIGKTQLAVEYAYRYKHAYSDIFWLQASSKELFRVEITKLADALSLPKKLRADEEQLFASVRYWLANHDMWLLILDNLEDFSLIDLIIPPESNGHVLLTAYAQATGSVAQSFPIMQMTIDEGVLLLLRRAKRIAPQASQSEAIAAEDYEQARLIAQEMDNFPLALDQAGAYIEEAHKSFADYLILYRKRRSELLNQRGQFPNGHPASLKATLLLAFDKVARVHPAALKLLHLLAFLHPDTIPEELITNGVAELNGALRTLASNPMAFDTAIRTLLRFSLVRRSANANTLSIHRIVQTILTGKLSVTQQHQWITIVVHLVDHTLSDIDLSDWHLFERYLPQAQQCANYIADWHLISSPAEHVIYRIGCYYYERALYSQAATSLTEALNICEQDEENMQEEMAACFNALALLARKQSEYEHAERFQQRSLALHERLWGPDHLETAPILNNLALLYSSWGKNSLAEPLYQRALAIYERASEEDPIEMANTLNNLGLLYDKQGKYTQAEALYQRAFTLRETHLPPLHPNIAQSMNNLAALYQNLGKFQQAGPLFIRALELHEQTSGPDHPDTALSLHNLAIFYHDQEQPQQAEPLLLRALEIYEKTLGPEHPDTALCLNTLALIYRSQEHYQQAEALYLRALVIYERIFNDLHADIAVVLNNLGRLYYTQGNYQQAEPLLQRALLIREETLGPAHPDTAISLANLAEIYTLQKLYPQAEALYQRALSIYKQAFGDKHPSIARTMESYASLLEHVQRTQEAKILRETARQMKKYYHHQSLEQET